MSNLLQTCDVSVYLHYDVQPVGSTVCLERKLKWTTIQLTSYGANFKETAYLTKNGTQTM